MIEHRLVTVSIGLPGHGVISETYDRLNVDDVVCWRLNTRPPYMQFSIHGAGPEIVGTAQVSALTFVAEMAREEAKQLGKRNDVV